MVLLSLTFEFQARKIKKEAESLTTLVSALYK
jgi:hypothetical protein